MNLRQEHLQQRTALLLLVAFMFGGLFGPVLHRASHSMAWADLRGPVSTDVTDACDHNTHDARFEVVVPALHDELCPLCLRHLTMLDAMASPSVSLYHVDAVVSLGDALVPTLHAASHLIRGPPPHA